DQVTQPVPRVVEPPAIGPMMRVDTTPVPLHRSPQAAVEPTAWPLVSLTKPVATHWGRQSWVKKPDAEAELEAEDDPERTQQIEQGVEVAG
ncbi:MAG TPA: hypothetical protein VK659_14625, partial [Asanoa sp.]|nr:hypothetical protein [Asanoa sp.]